MAHPAARLQAAWRIVPSKTVSFACQDNSANEIVANFFDTDPPSARLERGDRTVTVWQVRFLVDCACSPGSGSPRHPPFGQEAV